MKKTLIILLFLFLSFSATKRVSAVDEFRTEYDVTYEVNQDSETQVTQKVTLTNLKGDVIATTYALTVRQISVYDIEAFDNNGPMEFEVSSEDGGSKISTQFNETTIGQGRNTQFTIRYKSKDIATKVGEILNLKVPRVSGLDQIRAYNVNILLPSSFGPEIFISPKPKKNYAQGGVINLTFDKEALEESGISASYGKYQVLNYKLLYQLENKSAIAQIQEIALPPDIRERQQVNHKTLNPQPLRVYEDADSNLLALYKIPPGEKLEIELSGTVRIFGKQINPEFGGTFDKIPSELIANYTGEQKYWEKNSVEIQALKNKLYDSDQNVSENALKIYQFITQNLDYDFSAIEKDYLDRSGALAALTKTAPAACMEFTDLFIAVARAMGIPARELNGYSINTAQNPNLPLSIKLKSGDLLHAWPEYFDPNYGWVAIDPTWGNTSGLDFFTKLGNNHFTFVIKGLSSESPLPAGLYRTEETKELVTVDISQDIESDDFKYFLSFYKLPNLNLIQIFKRNAKYYIKNEGGTYIYDFQGEKILPYQVKSTYYPKDALDITFQDINYENKTSPIVFSDENPKKYIHHPAVILLSLLGGLLLCGSGYYFLIVKGALRKLPFLRLNPLRGQDQKRNRR